ncbi:MAG: hypothetical protein ACUVR2_07195 [Anaerolineae bacterium]
MDGPSALRGSGRSTALPGGRPTISTGNGRAARWVGGHCGGRGQLKVNAGGEIKLHPSGSIKVH